MPQRRAHTHTETDKGREGGLRERGVEREGDRVRGGQSERGVEGEGWGGTERGCRERGGREGRLRKREVLERERNRLQSYSIPRLGRGLKITIPRWPDGLAGLNSSFPFLCSNVILHYLLN